MTRNTVTNIMFIAITLLLSLSLAQAESINTEWNKQGRDSQWQNLSLSSNQGSVRVGYQLKFWDNESYASGHPSNMVSATPVYVDFYGGTAGDGLKVQLEVCFGDYDSARVPTYRVFCYPSRVLSMTEGSGHQWIEIDSDAFEVSTGTHCAGMKDIPLASLHHDSSSPNDFWYYEAHQTLRIWKGEEKIMDQRIDLLRPIVR